MSEILISSTFKLLQHTYSLGTINSTYRFRGQANQSWNLQPHIYRFAEFKRYQTVCYEEIILSFKPNSIVPHLLNTGLEFEWLMLCQHYGIPTRLLDWTTDALVALFFACYDEVEQKNDGALFIVNQNDYSILPAMETNPMEVQELSFINTSIINPRLRNQSGCFMAWGHSPLNKDKSTEAYDLWDYHLHNEDQTFLQKIIIPANCKPGILKELKNIYNISYDSIFISNGNLEKVFELNYGNLKNIAKLITLYFTDANRLNSSDEESISRFIKNGGRNMFHNCPNLKTINGVFRPNVQTTKTEPHHT